MSFLAAILVGTLTAFAVYCLLQRQLLRLIAGIVLLSQAVNFAVFSADGLRPASPPIVGQEAVVLSSGAADPLPQALVLTAIVIGFGLVAYALLLVARVYEETGDDDIENLRRTDT